MTVGFVSATYDVLLPIFPICHGHYSTIQLIFDIALHSYACQAQKCTYSFIHYGDLYSAPSRLLLRSAPDPCTTKKKSFEAGVECMRKDTGEQSLRQRKPIPHRGAYH